MRRKASFVPVQMEQAHRSSRADRHSGSFLMTEFYLKGCTLGANSSGSGSLIPAPQLKEYIPGTTCPSGVSEPLNFLNVVVTVPSTGGSVEW